MLVFDNAIMGPPGFALEANWTIGRNDQVAIIGPSGGGKSTLLNALGGFVPVQSGRILWEGRDLNQCPPQKRPVAMLFQSHNLFPHLTAAENVSLGLSTGRHFSRSERNQVGEALEQVGLAGLGQRKPSALSGGQQSRVALARVLLQRRPILALDEPFAALGPGLRAELRELVRELARDTNAALLMVTHDPQEARLFDYCCLVADAAAAAPVNSKTLFENPPAQLREYLGPA